MPAYLNCGIGLSRRDFQDKVTRAAVFTTQNMPQHTSSTPAQLQGIVRLCNSFYITPRIVRYLRRGVHFTEGAGLVGSWS